MDKLHLQENGMKVGIFLGAEHPKIYPLSLLFFVGCFSIIGDTYQQWEEMYGT
jgi:hypothetical protein